MMGLTSTAWSAPAKTIAAQKEAFTAMMKKCELAK